MGRSLGIATLFSWMSLNSYLTYSSDWAYIPNTIIQSSGQVVNGLIGILPVMIGIAMFTTTQLFSHFRFMSFEHSLFTMFYVQFGDTQFDTYYGAYQVNPLYTLILMYGWVWVGSNIVINITLAQVEDGYLH